MIPRIFLYYILNVILVNQVLTRDIFSPNPKLISEFQNKEGSCINCVKISSPPNLRPKQEFSITVENSSPMPKTNDELENAMWQLQAMKSSKLENLIQLSGSEVGAKIFHVFVIIVIVLACIGALVGLLALIAFLINYCKRRSHAHEGKKPGNEDLLILENAEEVASQAEHPLN